MAKNIKDGIELSPAYGLNPTMPICFWCGKDTGDIALLGRIRKKGDRNMDVEAPRHMVLNYNPCPNCEAQFNKGVLVAEAVPTEQWKDTEYGKIDPGRPEITKGAIPTGRFYVMREGVIAGAKAGDVRLILQEDFEKITVSEDE